MKKTYHLCLSGGTEVLFRNHLDYVRGINCLCLAAYKTESRLLAYTFMSNHVHVGVRTENPKHFIRTFRYPYTRYFNQRYGRKGRLGEREFFQLEIDGLYHLLAAVSYILRNPLHHAVCATPFGYRYSSVGAVFRKEMGHLDYPDLLSKKSQYLYLPEDAVLPPGFRMGQDGLILPESVIDVADIEHQFSTARTFLYYMNRLSGDSWEKEQLQDNVNQAPVSLALIEKGVRYQETAAMLANEHGRRNYKTMTDMELCEYIDSLISGRSIYSISDREIERIANHVVRTFHLPVEQINRCLAGRLPR